MKLAFVGLGNMGLPMAKNLVKVYDTVYGLNRSKGKEELFAQAGGKVGLSLPELAQTADVIMTCLPLPEDVHNVYFADDGILANGHPGLVAIDFSTVSPELSQNIYAAASEKNIDFLDAPISGGPPGAEAGTLSIMVGGKEEIFAKVKPVLEVMGKNIYYVGPSGSGSAVKLINQLMVGIHTQAVSEALVLAKALGLPFDKVFDILNNSFAQSRIFERHYTQFIAKDHYEPGFALELLHKDTNLVQELAEKKNLNLPVGQQVNELLREAKSSGYAKEDMSSMYKFIQEKNNRS
ncbi:6-phosphogluconate dehydrogenase NAD-binding [Caldalkalibacillus thermarum TA2.A1]|uniref:6-phosphogluconate dehydrogenase NAD-binding n=1 Tax=Caldalkalibacillus thermarum (strain TA2.A1) TaxID=986075 RepID=F5L4C7_CALTT|nr:NAD(P)-dependent oxidoreductase [Caldalkalibacillus thermarum]EGL83799.1 6-phosphogluconate dehydrogenase NAD-binding [Caldalkalibacillus thermarum TA2.A1]QZT34828.1 NAD(P)-dependent oxidoreductase [Caldalkalibacillus thermarum TA2.A1]